MDPQMAAMLGMAYMAGAPQFVSGAPQFVSGTMADIAGFGSEIAGDPVSALLGDPYGVMGFNPFSAAYHGLQHLNPFSREFLLRSHHHGNPAAAAAINAKIAQHGAAVVDRQNTKARKTVSPLVATVVGAGLNAVIPSNPQTLFLPETFVIPATIAPSFTVQDIKVGNVSQFPTTGDVPGEMFAQNAFNNGIRLDTVNPAINLSVSVTNISGGSLTFRGGFYGTLVQ